MQHVAMPAMPIPPLRCRLFLQSPANPDLLFVIFFCHTQLTITLLLGLIFGSKVSHQGGGSGCTLGRVGEGDGAEWEWECGGG